MTECKATTYETDQLPNVKLNTKTWADERSGSGDKVNGSHDTDNVSPTPSPIYYRGCFTNQRNELSLSLKRSESDPLQNYDNEVDDGMLNVSLKSREYAERSDLDHIIGAIAKEMVCIKHTTGFMPHYRCSGTKLSGRYIRFKCPDPDSFEFYKRTIRGLSVPGHLGYLVHGAGDPPPYRKYRAWIPDEMMDTLENIPEFLAIESDDVVNSDSIKIVGSGPSSPNGFMIYFEVTPTAEAYIRAYPSGVMCGAHNLKFTIVHEYGRYRRSPSVTPPSSVDMNWRCTPSPTATLPPLLPTDTLATLVTKIQNPTLQSTTDKAARRNSAPEMTIKK